MSGKDRISSIKDYLNLVKFAHTVFALPFALTGFTMGVLYLVDHQQFGISDLLLNLFLVLVCMVTARNAAMGYNRYADRDIDALNPRTADREIPKGKISERRAVVFIVVNIVIFLIAARLISVVCFVLSPVVLLVLLGYSKVKRFSAACHFVLGLSLALAPAGAFTAVLGNNITPDNMLSILNGWGRVVLLISSIVILWVSGFDILYSLADEDFDKQNNLHSIPALVGRRNAMIISFLLHILIIPILGYIYYFIYYSGVIYTSLPLLSNVLFASGVLLFTTLLIYQHCIISSKNLARLNAAFFTTNGLASFIFAIFTIIALILM